MKTKQRRRTSLALSCLASITLSLSLSQSIYAGTACEGYDGGVVFYCDGQGEKICHSITMNGETRVCHGVKKTTITPVVN